MGEPNEGNDLDHEAADDRAGAADEDVPAETHWPTGEPKLSPTETWMEHKGWVC